MSEVVFYNGKWFPVLFGKSGIITVQGSYGIQEVLSDLFTSDGRRKTITEQEYQALIVERKANEAEYQERRRQIYASMNNDQCQKCGATLKSRRVRRNHECKAV